MAFKKTYKDIAEEKNTGYHLDGQEIVLAKKRGRPAKIRNPLFTPQEVKIEAACLYCVLGDVKKVVDVLKGSVSEEEIRAWKEEPWWVEVQKKIMTEQNDGMLSKVNQIVENTLTELADRITNGDIETIPAVPAVLGKNGKVITPEVPAHIIRHPVKAKDLSQTMNHLFHQRNLMVGQEATAISPASVEKRLEDLAEQFRKLAKGTILDGDCKTIESE